MATDKKWKATPLINAFLAAIRLRPNITAAATAAGCAREAHYRQFERHEEYRTAFAEAYRIGVDAFEDETVRRAQDGVRKLVLYHGLPVMVPADWSKPKGKKVPLFEIEYSDSLAPLILKANKPDKYKDRVEQQHTGSIDIVERLNAGRQRLAKRNEGK